MRRVGFKRTLLARMGAGMGLACGMIACLAAVTGQTWFLSPLGWLALGILFALVAVFVLVDGAIAYQKARHAPRSLDD